MSNETDRVFQRQLQKLALEEQAATADYNAHLYSGDDDAAARCDDAGRQRPQSA